jgi:biotin carboxyl carrier protein
MFTRYIHRHWEVFFWVAATFMAGVLCLLIAGTISGANLDRAGDEPIPERTFIVSPCFGVFCAGEYPGSPPYVSVGSKVTPDTIVCNIQDRQTISVQAGVFGTIVNILVADDQMVFMGQPLFQIQLDPITE